ERILLKLAKGIPSLKHVVLAELEDASMKVVSARLGLDRDHAGYRLAELGIIILGCYLSLANRLKIRVDDDNAQDRVPILGAIQLIAGSAEVLAVHHDLRRALRVFARRVLPPKLLCARSKQHKLGEISVQYRQVRDLFLLEGGRDVGAICLQELSFAGGARNCIGCPPRPPRGTPLRLVYALD